MNKLGLFLLRFNGFFAFLILEIFSISLYFYQDATPEKIAFLSSANRVMGGMYDYSNRWTRYWNLAAVNDSLAKENARLKMKLPSSQFSHLVDSFEVVDKELQLKYQFTEAIVVNNSTHRSNNYLTLNRGHRHGIRPNTGVVNGSGDGIIGIVRTTSANYSSVMSVLNESTRISAKIRQSGYFGVIVWDGKNTHQMTLEAIPKHAQISKGDTVVTSGYSTIFPEGILIGTVDTFYIEAGSNFYTTKINLSADLNRVQYVYVVDDLMRLERLKLEKETQHE